MGPFISYLLWVFLSSVKHLTLNSLTTTTYSGYLQFHQINTNTPLFHFHLSMSNRDTETLSSPAATLTQGFHN